MAAGDVGEQLGQQVGIALPHPQVMVRIDNGQVRLQRRFGVLRQPLLVLFSACSAAGCSGGPRLAEVTGTVRLNGMPLANVMVEFNPDAATGARSTGTTDENGRYTLVCDDQRPGAIVGPHRVVLHDLAVYGGKFLGRKLEQVGTKDNSILKPSRIPRHYESTAHTPLKKEVKPEPQILDLEVTSS